MSWLKLPKLLGNQRYGRDFGPEDSATLTNSSIIVPLYIYPETGAWKPLYDCIQKHPANRFIVIVNPGNGPGPDSVPDANYLNEIPILTSYANVEVVGYVHTTFAQRNIAAVKHDIDTYSAWAEQAQYPGLAIHGIFVDETPNQYDAGTESYLREITEFAKSRSGFGKNKMVIHNPGCVPSPAYLVLADTTVVFEDTWKVFDTRFNDGTFDLKRIFGVGSDQHGESARDTLAIMIHSLPTALKQSKAKAMVKRAKQAAPVVFLTDLDLDYYSKWSSKWADWVSMIVEA